MTLAEKIILSKTCVNNKNGRCTLDGYPPFDCENCTTYIKIGVINEEVL